MAVTGCFGRTYYASPELQLDRVLEAARQVDTDFLARTYALNRAGRAQLQEGFAALGLDFVPSYTNFVLVRVGDAARVNGELLRRGVIVRPVAGDGLPEHLRVSIGLPEENARLLDALKAVLQA